MERIGDAFVWPFRDPKWVEKVAIIGLISLIPIVGGINGLGWMLASIERLRAGKEELPPGNFDYLGRGAILFLVLLVYSLAIILVAAVLFVPAIALLGIAGRHDGNAVLGLGGAALMLLAFGVTVLWALAMYFATPAIVLAVDRGGIAAGFDLLAIFRRVRQSPTNTLIAGLMLLAAGFISGLGSYACIVGLIFTVPYSLAMEAWIIRSYELGSEPRREEGLDVGHSAAPKR